MRAVTVLVVGLGLALMVVGVALIPLLHPTYTRLLAEGYSEIAQSGLTRTQVLHNAELVREFVVEGDLTTLPSTVNGRSGFDAAAVAHLRDVRDVLGRARVFTGVLAAFAVVWLGVETARRHFAAIAWALIAGAGFCALFVLLGAVAGSLSFDSLFSWFHGLFFAAGTWEFPVDSLLIELFPEGFWVAAGLTWAGLVALGGVVLGVAGWLVRGAEMHASAASTDGPS
jgi:integral membrane protein (TIGR01906 family)